MPCHVLEIFSLFSLLFSMIDIFRIKFCIKHKSIWSNSYFINILLNFLWRIKYQWTDKQKNKSQTTSFTTKFLNTCTQQLVKEEIEGENSSHNTFVWQEHPLEKWKKFEYVIRACPSGTIIARYCTSPSSARVYVSLGVNRSFSTTWLTIFTARCGTIGYCGRSMLDWHGPGSKL